MQLPKSTSVTSKTKAGGLVLLLMALEMTKLLLIELVDTSTLEVLLVHPGQIRLVLHQKIQHAPAKDSTDGPAEKKQRTEAEVKNNWNAGFEKVLRIKKVSSSGKRSWKA